MNFLCLFVCSSHRQPNQGKTNIYGVCRLREYECLVKLTSQSIVFKLFFILFSKSNWWANRQGRKPSTEESHAHQSLKKLMVWPQKQTFLTSQKVTCIHAWPHVGLCLDVCVHFLKDETGARWGKNLYHPHVSHISGFVREPWTTDRPQSEMRSTSKTPKDTSICPKMCR